MKYNIYHIKKQQKYISKKQQKYNTQKKLYKEKNAIFKKLGGPSKAHEFLSLTFKTLYLIPSEKVTKCFPFDIKIY